jgi:hypothetical protein
VVVNLVEVGNGGDGGDAGEDRQHRKEGQGENCPSIGILQKIHFIEALLKSQARCNNYNNSQVFER